MHGRVRAAEDFEGEDRLTEARGEDGEGGDRAVVDELVRDQKADARASPESARQGDEEDGGLPHQEEKDQGGAKPDRGRRAPGYDGAAKRPGAADGDDQSHGRDGQAQDVDDVDHIKG